jgi:hypothetical protein
VDHPAPSALAVGLIASVLDGHEDAQTHTGNAILAAMGGLDPEGRAYFTGAVTTAAAAIAAEAIRNMPDGEEWFRRVALALAAGMA